MQIPSSLAHELPATVINMLPFELVDTCWPPVLCKTDDDREDLTYWDHKTALTEKPTMIAVGEKFKHRDNALKQPERITRESRWCLSW
jgi:hypothetical protein